MQSIPGPTKAYYNPGANAIPGPSFQPPPPVSGQFVARTSSSGSQNGDLTKGTTRPAKKKAAKACLQCQRAHLTCDDSRPCQRCVKKGMGSECEEGLRKKAKYLMDDSEKATLAGYSSTRKPVTVNRNGNGKTSSPRIGNIGSISLPKPEPSADQGDLPRRSLENGQAGNMPGDDSTYYAAADGLPDPGPSRNVEEGQFDRDVWQETDMMYDNLPFDPAYPFGSEAANLEYAMLSSMFADSGTVTTPTLHANSNDPPLFTIDNEWPESVPLGQTGLTPAPLASSSSVLGNVTVQTQLPLMQPFSMSGTATRDVSRSAPPGEAEGIAGLSFTGSAGAVVVESPTTTMTPRDVYSLVVKPHDYTEGYHDLMKHLAKNFNQASTLRVARALAAFRPSLIALQMPLTTEDEVFLEKSFQRTLIELEKLISYNGTPTAVWRRTGEICLAGDEFCKLVDKSRTELVGRKKYIYHLFDNHSTVDYFEKFSQYAFENTTQNFFMQVTLVVVEVDPQREPSETTRKIPCAGSFTIRRDVFDLPSVIIGQLLPTNA